MFAFFRTNRSSRCVGARARVSFLTEGYFCGMGGTTRAFITDDVDVLCETPDAVHIKYSDRFKERYPIQSKDDVIRKDDNERFYKYTRFVATIADCNVESPKWALFSVKARRQHRENGYDYIEQTYVLTVEETDRHWRIRFRQEFAEAHPELCCEWVRKEGTNPRIELWAPSSVG